MTFHSRPKTASAQTLIQMTVDNEPDKIKAAKALIDLTLSNTPPCGVDGRIISPSSRGNAVLDSVMKIGRLTA